MKKPSEKEQLRTVIVNLQNLLWLAAHLNGGSIKITRAQYKAIDLSAARLDVLPLGEGAEPGYEIRAAFNLQS